MSKKNKEIENRPVVKCTMMKMVHRLFPSLHTHTHTHNGCHYIPPSPVPPFHLSDLLLTDDEDEYPEAPVTGK